MTTPLPAEIVLPTGQPAYLNPYSGTYSTSRSYALRMQSGYSRGLPQSAARRGPGAYQAMQQAGTSEARARREAYLAQYGQTPWQRFTQSFESRYGFSYTWWRRMQRRYVREINSEVSPSAQVQPWMVNYEIETGHDLDHVEALMANKLKLVRGYQTGQRATPEDYAEYDPGDLIEWWWYH